jgi:hypothetical protein
MKLISDIKIHVSMFRNEKVIALCLFLLRNVTVKYYMNDNCETVESYRKVRFIKRTCNSLLK